MAPSTTTETIPTTMPTKGPQSTQAAGVESAKVKMQMPTMPKFETKLEEREYLKGRLAAAFRIFGKYGYDEGMVNTMNPHIHKDERSSLQVSPATSLSETPLIRRPSG